MHIIQQIVLFPAVELFVIEVPVTHAAERHSRVGQPASRAPPRLLQCAKSTYHQYILAPCDQSVNHSGTGVIYGGGGLEILSQ